MGRILNRSTLYTENVSLEEEAEENEEEEILSNLWSQTFNGLDVGNRIRSPGLLCVQTQLQKLPVCTQLGTSRQDAKSAYLMVLLY